MVRMNELVSFYGDSYNSDKARLTLVSISLESALLGHDVKTYERVILMLKKKYGCTISDCYKHPEYLDGVLKTLPKSSRSAVIKSVQRALEEFSDIKPIAKFLDGLK